MKRRDVIDNQVALINHRDAKGLVLHYQDHIGPRDFMLAVTALDRRCKYSVEIIEGCEVVEVANHYDFGPRDAAIEAFRTFTARLQKKEA